MEIVVTTLPSCWRPTEKASKNDSGTWPKTMGHRFQPSSELIKNKLSIKQTKTIDPIRTCP